MKFVEGGVLNIGRNPKKLDRKDGGNDVTGRSSTPVYRPGGWAELRNAIKDRFTNLMSRGRGTSEIHPGLDFLELLMQHIDLYLRQII